MNKINELPTLYKTSNRDKIEEWKTWVQVIENIPTIFVEYGNQGGAKQVKTTEIKKGKNIGKSNETNPYDQARLESTAKWNKQKDKGYSETIEAKTERITLPMLAHSWKDYAHKIVFPCFIQPKLDGLRCLASSDRMWSRKNKEFTSLPNLSKLTSTLPKNIILDGELYSHTLTFQEITSIVRKQEVSDKSDQIEYHTYDLINLNNSEMSFKDRHRLLKTFVGEDIKFVETKEVNQDQVQDAHQQFLAAGYEGSILRNIDAKYEIDKRSFHLLKLKDFLDAEFNIIGAEQDKNGHAVFRLVMNDGQEFSAKPTGTDAERTEMWNRREECVGKMATVKYFELSDTGIPRFPVVLSIRDYE